ncbi:polysaccharide (de)acetylase [Flavobacterium aciduliphilum]|uniref:Polysaccharide (De)acetylase n=1 Tax=Flavobacterium aciduliphilum TaxID=1101402 RepID=A0A328Y889_9FLAO|nr:polysaccharide (de)acetylase [Flavobacterium aciduliphilum]RAR70248.1 hypothetical protein CLV55_11173 [Flavobacterium aciduliphilum]
MSSLVHNITSYFKNNIGFKTNRKIVVIESDDWGSIRMPSRDLYESLNKKGIVQDSNRYDNFDTLANKKDLEDLYDVIHSVKDQNGNPAKFTPIAVLANPDYKKIQADGFKKYHYELFTDRLRNDGEFEVLELWEKGVKEGFFKPQYHGREHLNVTKWMKALQEGHEKTIEAFHHGVYGITFDSSFTKEDNYLAAYDFYDPSEIELLKEITIDGLNQFEKVFGFRATYFVPPNGPLSSELNQTFSDNGVKGIQTARLIYKEPIGYGTVKKRFRYFGKNTGYNQIYTLRNAVFEPDEPVNFDWKMKCISDLDIAFRYKKPAVVSSHRVNYIGRLVPQNRDKSLIELKALLQMILKKWPDVEFMTSDELIDLMLKK